jgi:hypothetical protein
LPVEIFKHFFSVNIIIVNIIIVIITKYFSGDQIKKNEMGGACSTYGWEERCIQGFGGET